MLDTNAVSDLVRNPRGSIAESVRKVGIENVSASIIVAGEIAFGLENHRGDRLRKNVESILSSLNIVPMEEPVDLHYGLVRAALKRAGTPIGPNDIWIAAHALALGATLVTDNEREFSRVPGLKIENWLRPEGAA